MWSCASLSSWAVVTPGTTCGVSMCSTSDASLPATRMPSISAALLIEIVIPELSHRGPRIAGFHGGDPTSGSIPPEMSSRKHLHHFEGGNALSDFRAQALLERLRAAVDRVDSIRARHLHVVWSDAVLERADLDRAAALLRYGDPFVDTKAADVALIVAPRLGTVSPWASKATDIARNCGLAVHRIERATEYRIGLKRGLLGGARALDAAERDAVA